MRIKIPHRQYTSIPLQMLLHIAWRNLVSKKLRTFLTIFGVIIGIGSIFFLLSFGLGLQNLVTREIIGNQSIKSIDVTSPNSKIIQLDETSISRISGLPHVERLGSSLSYSGSLKLEGGEVDTIVYGVDTTYQELSNLSLIAGRMLQKDDFRSLFINRAAAQALGIEDEKSAVNKELSIYIPLQGTSTDKQEINERFTVVGVIDSGSGSEVFLPNFVFESAGVKAYSQVKIVVDDTNNVPDLRRQIESQGFETTSPIDTIDQINQIFTFFNYVLVGFGAIGMIVAVLGMFNTLTISLLERTREIGLMIALGGRNRDMRKLFIFEAVLLSVVGAAVGIALAFVAGRFINAIMNNFARGRGVSQSFDLFATPLWLVASLIGFMVVVGLIVVFFPARRAEKINPIDALRRE